MTSTADTTQHPDVTEISDLTEELLPPSRAAEVRDHVDGCELCGEVHASLMEIRELLGTVPTPQRMPDDIADRIDAALAAEAALGATPTSGSLHVSRETEPPAAEKPKAEPSPSDRPAGRPRATTGPGRRPLRRRRTAVLGAALGAAVVGVSVFLLQNVQPSQNSGSLKAADRSSSAEENGGGTFSESTLEDRVHTLLLSTGSKPSKSVDGVGAEEQTPSTGAQSTPPRSASAGSESPQTPLRAPTVPVPPCVEQGTGRDTAALAVEEGTYEGTDVFLVVLPHPSDAARVQAYVVDAACVQAEPAGKGELLLTRTYPRR
ncbi:hypothetical protein [Streptomyces sp. NPDC024089]|uniref:hypothetical protein n=1 Tax=Streptomyces sp. NPDC024089 TaxID=3154328 RepID=UPI0033DA0591